ncbi:MauE/DoxX family redox-associated membrane protein [Chitinophaga sp. Ak27]|uniref:MauE/DoxX family redox-associated membrane protein n=1 Tax=Chitinophaga sp. Ak27 TaxID=2726116 RepID=UPI00145F8E5A|nr:MauE/DoxX family redox-associated membrane protein [Chitinophaga sp. Ak27]NLU94868.1 hypothetical protein [Chitinophaga sp. Ak27]
MNSKTFRTLSTDVISLLYVSLMLYTAISKVRTFTETREQLSLMPLMERYSDVVAFGLPGLEVIISILIFIPRTRRIGLYAVSGLMILFTIYVAYLIRFHPHLPCTCGGFISALSWPQHLIFNSAFIALGILAIYLDKRSRIDAGGNNYHFV